MPTDKHCFVGFYILRSTIEIIQLSCVSSYGTGYYDDFGRSNGDRLATFVCRAQ